MNECEEYVDKYILINYYNRNEIKFKSINIYLQMYVYLYVNIFKYIYNEYIYIICRYILKYIYYI